LQQGQQLVVAVVRLGDLRHHRQGVRDRADDRHRLHLDAREVPDGHLELGEHLRLRRLDRGRVEEDRGEQVVEAGHQAVHVPALGNHPPDRQLHHVGRQVHVLLRWLHVEERHLRPDGELEGQVRRVALLSCGRSAEGSLRIRSSSSLTDAHICTHDHLIILAVIYMYVAASALISAGASFECMF